MRTPAVALWVLTMTLAGCSSSAPAVSWSRVVRGHAAGRYSIVHVDPLTDTCVSVTMQPLPMLSEEETGIDVTVEGAASEVWAARGIQMFGQACTNDFTGSKPTSITGKVEFDNFVNSQDPALPCDISFDLVILDADGQTYEISESDVPITDVGCPRPNVYSAEYTDIRAAFGEYQGLATLVISNWDPQLEVCVWARFLSTNDIKTIESAVDAEGTWFYSGLRFALSGPDACVASNLVVPPIDPSYLSDTAPVLGSSGVVSFRTTETREVMSGPLEVPCTLDVDLSLQSAGRYRWSPDDVAMHGSKISVAGACE